MKEIVSGVLCALSYVLFAIACDSRVDQSGKVQPPHEHATTATEEVRTIGHPRPGRSWLWGDAGEFWSPTSRLPDMSFAGYRMGNEKIPTIRVKITVSDKGARAGDGVDDGAAFQAAINAVSEGAVLIPAGVYDIERVLRISKKGIVLRGSGPGTVLRFARPLSTMLRFKRPFKTMLGHGPCGGRSGWSWCGGAISVEGTDAGEKLAEVRARARRGDKALVVSTISNFTVGRRVRLVLDETVDGSLMQEILHRGGHFRGRTISWVANVVAVDAAARKIILDRPLRTDVELAWSPRLHAYAPEVYGVGIEDLTVDFPNGGGADHFEEQGYNGLELKGVSDCWVRNVRIKNADSGIYIESGTRFTTLDGVVFSGRGGHHGIEFDSGSSDNLFTNFVFDTMFIHDITVQLLAHGNVISRGRGVNLNFDHHRAAPFENLFTDIDVGRGDRVWESSGDVRWGGANSAARETFWNIRDSAGAPPRGLPGWPQMNVVGATRTNVPPDTSTIHPRAWIEGMSPSELFPSDIHAAQVARRRASPSNSARRPQPR